MIKYIHLNDLRHIIVGIVNIMAGESTCLYIQNVKGRDVHLMGRITPDLVQHIDQALFNSFLERSTEISF